MGCFCRHDSLALLIWLLMWLLMWCGVLLVAGRQVQVDPV
jgi:hypothetical protein